VMHYVQLLQGFQQHEEEAGKECENEVKQEHRDHA
jgi:hypothetical protein